MKQIKAQIQELKDKGYSISKSKNKDGVYIYMNDSEDNEAGRILLKKEDEELYEVEYVGIVDELRGFGKVLYYIAMDYVYPAWICADMTGYSEDAERVYKGMRDSRFVEFDSYDGSKGIVSYRESDKEYLSNVKYRFRFLSEKQLDELHRDLALALFMHGIDYNLRKQFDQQAEMIEAHVLNIELLQELEKQDPNRITIEKIISEIHKC